MLSNYHRHFNSFFLFCGFINGSLSLFSKLYRIFRFYRYYYQHITDSNYHNCFCEKIKVTTVMFLYMTVVMYYHLFVSIFYFYHFCVFEVYSFYTFCFCALSILHFSTPSFVHFALYYLHLFTLFHRNNQLCSVMYTGFFINGRHIVLYCSL